jgi:hypothetical protein
MPPIPFSSPDLDLWWAVPNRVGGMSMPFIHPRRHDRPNAGLDGFPDELPALWRSGIRAIVSLLNIRSLAQVYPGAGFVYHSTPIPDGGVPSLQQFEEFLDFVALQLSANRPVAVHCAAGLGRTGTMLAGYLIAHGLAPREAITRIRSARPGAIETIPQVEFLERLGRRQR